MKSILSTKLLSRSQQELLLHASVPFVHYNAIGTVATDFNIPETEVDAYIFTSQNAVRAVLDKRITKKPCFCVGSNTKNLLQKEGFEVKGTADQAQTLAKTIVENYQNERLVFFCGNRRREELPEFLSKYNIRYTEIVVYNTHWQTKTFVRDFEAVLFFSPSGVKSFCRQNSLKNTTAICIGPTTAAEAQKYTQQIIIANRPSVENVLVQAVKHLKKMTHD